MGLELGLMSAFLMVSLFADAFNHSYPITHQQFAQHPWWNNQRGWKHLLNNLRLIIQPLICFNWRASMVRSISHHFFAVWI